MNFGSTDWIVVAIVAICVILVIVLPIAGYYYVRRRRVSRAMRQRFGLEYDRLLKQTRSRRTTETRLLERERRVASYDIRPLRPDDRVRYQRLWHDLQAEFVDNPNTAVAKADAILADLMADRGYPTAEFDRRAADLSVHHPSVAQNYRLAHAIVTRQCDGKASTEELRQAIVQYKALFNELVSEQDNAPPAHAAE